MTVVELSHGDHRAEIDTVGARLRRLVLDGVEVTPPLPDGGLVEREYWGAVLAPWPNRMADGRMTFEGQVIELPVNEPRTGSALHGLVDTASFVVQDVSPSRVRLACASGVADQGWPSSLKFGVTWELSSAGLSGQVRASNVGANRCPVALGAHTYFDPGGSMDDVVLDLPATTMITTDERLLPLATVDHLPGPVPLDGQALDNAFGDLRRDAEGTVTAVIHRPDGVIVELAGDASVSHLQVFTGDAFPGPRCRSALALEPITCGPDGLNRGEGAVLAPGESMGMSFWVALR